jgi:CyaY protein
LFLAIEHWLEQSQHEIDFESQQGLLTLTFVDGSQMVISRQPSLQEIWLAYALGAYHFRQVGTDWQTTQQESLLTVIAQALQQKNNITLDIADFPKE